MTCYLPLGLACLEGRQDGRLLHWRPALTWAWCCYPWKALVFLGFLVGVILCPLQLSISPSSLSDEDCLMMLSTSILRGRLRPVPVPVRLPTLRAGVGLEGVEVMLGLLPEPKLRQLAILPPLPLILQRWSASFWCHETRTEYCERWTGQNT